MTQSHIIRQPDFTGGEIAPIATGHTDSPAYAHGLRLALNFIPTLEGPLQNRSGSRFLAEVLDEPAGDDSTLTPRLIPFSFSDGQTFVLEFGNLTLRVFQSGALVSGLAVPIVTPWAIADAMRLQWSQSGDVITFCCSRADPAVQYAVYEVQRISNTNWQVVLVNYSGTAYWHVGGPIISATTTPNTSVNPNNHGAALSSENVWDAATLYAVGEFVVFNAGGARFRLYQCVAASQNQPPDINPAYWQDWTWDAAKTYSRGAYVWTASTLYDGQPYMCLQDNSFNQDPTIVGTPHWVLACDTSRPTKKFQFVVTIIYKDGNGGIFESLASEPTTDTVKLGIYTDRPARIDWIADGIPSGSLATGYSILSYYIYGGHNGVWGFLGAVDAVTSGLWGTFNYDGTLPPDFGVQPPRGTNPFDIASGSNTTTQSYPACVTNHEQRVVYARSNAKPQDFWGSAIGKPKTFDINTPTQDSDGFNFKPASEQLEEIRALLSLRTLKLFTSAGEWTAEGAGGPITASSIILRRSSQHGSGWLRPLAVEQSAVFYTKHGRVRDLLFEWRSQTDAGHDISIIARHLFDGHSIVDWAFAKTPHHLIYAVRDDGVLLTLTYAPGGAEAWAQHKTAGRFERVCTILETDANGNTEDAVYVVVRRVINGAPKRYIERFQSRVLPLKKALPYWQPGMTVRPGDVVRPTIDSAHVFVCTQGGAAAGTLTPGTTGTTEPAWNTENGSETTDGTTVIWESVADGTNAYAPDQRLGCFLDCSLQYDGRGIDAAITLTGANFAAAQQITLTAAANFIDVAGVARGLTAADIDAAIVVDPDGLYGGPYSARIVAVASALSATLELDDTLPASFQAVPLTGDTVAFAPKTLTGLGHLEGMFVTVLQDGAVAGPFQVLGGSITLDSPAVIAQVGLSYNSDLELLDIAADLVKTNVKTVRKVSFEVVSSRGILAGETFRKLSAPQIQRVDDGTSIPPLLTGLVEIPIGSTWNKYGRAVLRQQDPLPLTVVAVERELVVGGR